MRLGLRKASLLVACAGVAACTVFASKAELRLVDRLRAEEDPLARARLLADYDTRFGETGRLASRVDPDRQEIEDGLWQLAVDRGLEEREVRLFLELYPRGRHSQEATRRLDQLRYFAEADAARLEAKRQAEEAERQRVEQENERERIKVRTGLERFLRTALSLPRWGTTIEALSALDAGFREQWEGEPAPVCVEGICRRTLTAHYFFARTGSTRVDRAVSLVLEVDTREGRVHRLVGYYTGRGFVDWLEMSSEQTILEENGPDREAARDAMIAMTGAAVAAALPTAAEVETDEAGVLVRFRSADLEITLREFPPTYAAGRVDGFEVTYTGTLEGDAGAAAGESD
jgi:hypothetical protein